METICQKIAIYYNISHYTSTDEAYGISHLDSLYMLNFHISTSIDNSHFPYFENIWHIDSGINNYII